MHISPECTLRTKRSHQERTRGTCSAAVSLLHSGSALRFLHRLLERLGVAHDADGQLHERHDELGKHELPGVAFAVVRALERLVDVADLDCDLALLVEARLAANVERPAAHDAPPPPPQRAAA